MKWGVIDPVSGRSTSVSCIEREREVLHMLFHTCEAQSGETSETTHLFAMWWIKFSMKSFQQDDSNWCSQDL